MFIPHAVRISVFVPPAWGISVLILLLEWISLFFSFPCTYFHIEVVVISEVQTSFPLSCAVTTERCSHISTGLTKFCLHPTYERHHPD